MGIQEFFEGVGDKIKDVYYAGEEKWYKGLDKIDEHVAIYKVIDRIDEVVPSFALFLILIFVLILLFLISLSGAMVAPEATLFLSVQDSTGKNVSNVELEFAPPVDDVFYSNEFGQVENVFAPLNSKISLTAKYNNNTYNFDVEVDEETTYKTITLPIEVIRFDATTARFVTSTGALITPDEITVTFSCTNPEATPPTSQTTTNGTISVGKPSNCGTLSVTALSNNYEVRAYNLVQASNTVYMNEVLGAMSRVTVSLTSDGSPVQENIPVYAYRASNPFSTDFDTVSSNGQAILDLPAGDYYIKTMAAQGYKSEQSDLISVSEGNPTSVSLTLEKAILGVIKVRVEEGSSPIEGINISLKKGASEILAKTSDTNGEAVFEVEESGPFRVLATSDDYCPEYADAVVGETTVIKMKESTGTCGYDLQAKVLDSKGKPVPYAKVLIFGDGEDGIYKVGYAEKVTDFNGEVVWKNIPASEDNYKLFAYKSSYSGWSTSRMFDGSTQDLVYEILLNIPLGNVNVLVKDNDGLPIQFAQVQLFDSHAQDPATGIRLVEESSGLITFSVRADKKVYAVVKAEGYETLTTAPKQIVGDGTITFEATLSKPPLEEVNIKYLGFFKDEKRALSVEAGKEYEVRFAVTAPIAYDELGFFMKVGADNITKTELDKIYIKELNVPAKHSIVTGSSFNPPTGYIDDSRYTNLEESKWAQVIWKRNDFVPGKIIVSAKVKIKSTAQDNEVIDVAYRAWGVSSGLYERSPEDSVLGTARTSSALNELYAKQWKAWISVGNETLCEDKFCITSRYTDSDGFTNSFDTAFDAENNANYDLYLKILNGSESQEDSYYNSATKIENKEENIDMGDYVLITPNNAQSTGNITTYETDWLSTPNFVPGSEITFTTLKVRPEKEGTGTIKMRIRDGSRLVYEKEFSMYIAASKKFKIQFMKDNEFGAEMPDIPSGKEDSLTIKIFNTSNNLEVSGAKVKLFDRFGTKIYESETNTVGTATMVIPSSLPGEKLILKVEKIGYQTLEHPFNISEQVVDITPINLSFTVNPQTQKEDIKSVKISNSTGLDLTVESIVLTGKFYGLLSESKIETWFTSYKGTVIKSNDYEEFNFKVVSADSVTTADDLDGTFTITLRNGTYAWTEDLGAKIRVGLGKDVDDPNCLEISKNTWTANTQGEEISISFDVTNNCTVDGQLVGLNGLSAKNIVNGNNAGKYSVQSGSAFSDLSSAYYRTILNKIGPGETVPFTIKFTPFAGVNSTTTGTISIRALNETDSQDQELLTGLDYTLNVVNLKDCLVIGADLIRIESESSSSFGIQNNCPSTVDMSITSELSVSNKTFSIPAGGSQDVTVTRYEDDVPGAYNILVYGRQAGSGSQLLGNVKAILDPESDECIRLSRYEFDVYDSTGSETDGYDTATVSNHCLYQNVTVNVSGEEEEDWDKIWMSAAIGALAGWATCERNTDGSFNWECLLGFGFGDSNKGTYTKLTGNSTNKSIRNQTGKESVEGRSAQAAAAVTAPAYENVNGELLTLANGYESKLGTPANTVVETQKVKEEIDRNLEAQKVNLYEDKGLIRNVGSALYSDGSTTISAVGSGLSAIGGFFSSGWSALRGTGLSEEAKVAEEKKATISTQNALMDAIDQTKANIAREVTAIEQANTTFQQNFESTYNQIKQRTDTQRSQYNALIQQGKAPSNDEMEAEYREILREGTDQLAQTYTREAEKFNKTAGEKLDNIIAELEGNKRQLGEFETAINASNRQLDTETEEYVTRRINSEIEDMEEHYDEMIADEEERKADAEEDLDDFNDKYDEAQEGIDELIQKRDSEITRRPDRSAEITRNYATRIEQAQARQTQILNRIEDLESIEIPGHTNRINELRLEKAQKVKEIEATRAQTTETRKAKLKEVNNEKLKRIAIEQANIDALIQKVRDIKANKLAQTEQQAAEERAEEVAKAGLEKERVITEEEARVECNSFNGTLKEDCAQNETGVAISRNENNKACCIVDKTQSEASQTAQQESFKCSQLGGEYKETCAADEIDKSTEYGITTGKCCITQAQNTNVSVCSELGGSWTTIGCLSTEDMKDNSKLSHGVCCVPNQEKQAAKAECESFGEDRRYRENDCWTGETHAGALSSQIGTCCMTVERYCEETYSGSSFSATTLNPNKYENMGNVSGPGGINTGYCYKPIQAQGAGAFILSSSTSSMDTLSTVLTSGMLGTMGNSALVGGLLAGLTAWLQEQDKTVEYNDSGSAGLMVIDSISLDVSQIGLSIGETKYDYGDVTTPTIATTSSGWTSSGRNTGTSGSSNTSSYYYNATSQSATQGLIEKKKLTFTNNGFVTDSPYNPLTGLLTVLGTITTYNTQYDFEDVGYDFNAAKLEVSETFELEQQFHLLFNSWGYEDVPIQIDYAQSCTVGQKTGATGAEVVPRILLEWDWAAVKENTCDESNENYVYCDSTQFTIELLKKIDKLKTFFQSTPLPNCPQAIDVAGTKTQSLKENSIDVGITRIWMEATSEGARINATVQSNNQLEMSANVEFELEQGESPVSVNCSESKTFISSVDYSCEVETSQIGTGNFSVRAVMTPELCAGCENNDTTNDTITTTLILASENIQECSSYDTKSNNFQNLLAANNISTTQTTEIMSYVEFNTNLVKDGFSNDFKSDFDVFSMELTNAPTSYTTGGLRELFLSDKFEFDWPQQPGGWKAGKYSVNIIVEFNEDSWTWDNANENIKKITVELDPWGNPDPYYAIYDVAFNGPVGLTNERNGYGSNYEQMTEKAFVITNKGGKISATPNPSNNAVSNVEVSVIDSFYTINNVNRGNVLTISRYGDDVRLAMSPSVVVPLILNISRNQGRDAFAFYSVEVDGQPQNTGSYLMTWSGIGGNCKDFHGQSMLVWDDSLDQPASESSIGAMGSNNAYGLAWANAEKRGTVSLYGTMFVPSGKSSILSMSSSGDSASFESTHGSGTQITINPSSGINSLKDVFDKVKSGEICVVDGREYFWNVQPFLESMNLEGKEGGCITN